MHTVLQHTTLLRTSSCISVTTYATIRDPDANTAEVYRRHQIYESLGNG